MLTFIKTEFLKLKHSKIFLLTVLGALSIPSLLYIGLLSYKEMLISEILLCLSFSPFVVLSLVMPNMVFSMVAGAIFSIINLFVYTSKYAPYIPWCSPYLISSNEIANYSCNTATSLAILLVTFAIGLTISYIYFTKKDVCL